jgi:hypothetical protein
VVLNLEEWVALIKAGTYVELCRRVAEIDLGQKQCGMALLDRIALRVRGFSGNS